MKKLLRKKCMEYAENNNAKNIVFDFKQSLFMSKKMLTVTLLFLLLQLTHFSLLAISYTP